jgi:hypothetical protein
MFRKNQRHLQRALFSDLDYLSKKIREHLEESWAGVFRREFFCRLDERPFAVLYSDEPSRPNTPINVLVGLEALKSGFGWSDAEMHDAFLFDLQVRYALGYENIGEGDFELRTVYNFRRRVCDYMSETGENLVERAFEQVTDEQAVAFEIKTGRLRMDSSQIASNIQRTGRLQLLVEVLQRVHRMLSATEQAQYTEAFALYLKGSSGQYVYHLKGEDTQPHLQRIGALMHRLVIELASAYQWHETYQTLERVFHEQFILSEDESSFPSGHDEDVSSGPSSSKGDRASVSASDEGATAKGDLVVALAATQEAGAHPATAPAVQVRPGKEISPSSLRSPDDTEATYRKKGGVAYEGYVFNLTESCDPGNPFQLIVKMQSAPNTTEDTTLLGEALPDLKTRTDLHTLYNDAGFCGSDVDEQLRKLEVEQVPTALRGRAPDPNHTTLADCAIHLDADGLPVKLVCPHGHTAHVISGRKEGRFIARWTDTPCPECHFSTHHTGPRPSTQTCLRFGQVDLDRALRRQRMRAYHLGHKSLRAAVEATVGAIKRPFGNDKVPVRGNIRLNQMLIGSAAMVNIRRIQRYLMAKHKEDQQIAKEQTQDCRSGRSFWSFLRKCLHWYLMPIRVDCMTPVFGF